MNKAIKIVTCIVVCICITAFWVIKGNNAIVHAASVSRDSTNTTYKDIYNKQLVDSAISFLRTGDVVLRMGMGADSYLLAMLNRKDKAFSHCGIVVIENGKPMVYHSIGGEDNPDERLRRDPAAFFLSPLHNTAIAVVRYNYTPQQIDTLTHIVHQYYKQRPKFDMKFSLATDDQLYCSEFVYKAINKATADTTYIGTSTISGSRFVAIDDIFINPHAHIVWQTKFKQYLCSQK